MHIDIRGTRFYFDVEGAGLVADGPAMRERPTILMVHGGPGFDHSHLRPQHSALAAFAQVVYFDQRGCGRSDRDSAGHWTLSTWADDLRDFCDALGIVKPLVLGSSFGGVVAMKYAARYPDHPGKLLLVSTFAKFRLDRALTAFQRLGGERARETARAFWEDPGGETMVPYVEQCLPLYTRKPRDSGLMQRLILNLDVLFGYARGEFRTFDLRSELGQVRCPTLVIAGEDDPITPPETANEIAAALPAGLARLVRFPGCGHEVVHDDPEGYLRTIKAFVSAREG